MNELRLKYPVRMMRRIMNVSASGYYAWVDRPLSKRAQEEVRLELEIMAAHQRNRQTYGPERLQRDLAEHGVRVGVCRIKRIRQKLGIRCKQKRRFKTTTNSAHRLPVADNLLGQQFKVSQPNAVWVSDITYIPTDEGWLYLAGHKDLFTGELVGYAMGERMTRNLVSQSLFRALRAKRPARGLMHHSDRGSQYCSQEYRNLMERSGLRSSMSGKGNCFDNAPMESFWGTLKQELVHHRHYRSRQEAIRDMTEYIEIFYTGITHIKLPGSKQRTILDESHRSISHGCRQPSNQAHKTISRRGELAAPGSGGGFHHVCTPFKLLRARTSPLVASLHL